MALEALIPGLDHGVDVLRTIGPLLPTVRMRSSEPSVCGGKGTPGFSHGEECRFPSFCFRQPHPPGAGSEHRQLLPAGAPGQPPPVPHRMQAQTPTHVPAHITEPEARVQDLRPPPQPQAHGPAVPPPHPALTRLPQVQRPPPEPEWSHTHDTGAVRSRAVGGGCRQNPRIHAVRPERLLGLLTGLPQAQRVPQALCLVTRYWYDRRGPGELGVEPPLPRLQG